MVYTLCDAAGGCPQPSALTPVRPAIVPAVVPALRPPVAAARITQPTRKCHTSAGSRLDVSFAFLHTHIDAAQRARIAHWVATQSDHDWQHYTLLVHFTHQGRQSQRLAQARAEAVIALLDGLGLKGIPVTAMTDGTPHRDVGITHIRCGASGASAPSLTAPVPTAIAHSLSATTVPTASAAGAAPRREEPTPTPETH